MLNLRHISSTLLAVALAAAPAHALRPQVSATIDSASITMGSLATISVDIADPDGNGLLVDMPQPGSELAGDHIDIVAVEADTFPSGYQYRVQVQAFKPGSYTFAPFRFVSGNDTVESDFVTLKVLPVELDSLSTINPMASVANPPRRWYDYLPDWLAWVALALAAAALAVAVLLLYRKNGPMLIHKPKPVDPYQAAMAELSRLRQSKLAENGNEKEYYTRLVDILRIYLDRRFGINAMEMSTTQILQSLRANPDTRGNQPRIKQILELADFVKFANIRPLPDDNIKTFNNVVQFVEDTKPVAEAPGDEKAGDKAAKTR